MTHDGERLFLMISCFAASAPRLFVIGACDIFIHRRHPRRRELRRDLFEFEGERKPQKKKRKN